jgi:peptidoglycan/xylan/chitin deacetylase (PgdA/CDA1 family)
VPPARGALYVATIGAFALLVRVLMYGAIPLWISAVAMTAYGALITLGVLFLRLGMFVDVVWRGPKEARGVALTFDDGPSPEHTTKILDLLDEAKVKAAFFVIGKKAEKHPELVREIKKRGHLVGLHSYAHDRLFSLRTPGFVRDDLKRGLDVLEGILGERTSLFRPPIGHTSPRIAKVVDEMDLIVVGWSVRGLDGLAGAKADRVATRVASQLEDGAIVLLHDALEREDKAPASVEALPKILAAMRDRDLKAVRLDQWIED